RRQERFVAVDPQRPAVSEKLRGDVKHGRHAETLELRCRRGVDAPLPVIERQQAERSAARPLDPIEQVVMMDEVEPAAEDVDVLAGLCGGERMFVDDDAAAGGAPELPQPGNN